MEGFEQNKVGRWLELHHNMQLGSEGGRYCMVLPPFLLSGSTNGVRSQTSSAVVRSKPVEHMARHVPNTSHEFNIFRLWAWERFAQKSRGPDGLTSWILAMA